MISPHFWWHWHVWGLLVRLLVEYSSIGIWSFSHDYKLLIKEPQELNSILITLNQRDTLWIDLIFSFFMLVVITTVDADLGHDGRLLGEVVFFFHFSCWTAWTKMTSLSFHLSSMQLVPPLYRCCIYMTWNSSTWEICLLTFTYLCTQ